jgi:cation diffusion facilitator CzcD-associated flavoprotein CzcO
MYRRSTLAQQLSGQNSCSTVVNRRPTFTFVRSRLPTSHTSRRKIFAFQPIGRASAVTRRTHNLDARIRHSTVLLAPSSFLILTVL